MWRLNISTISCQFRNSCYKDKTHHRLILQSKSHTLKDSLCVETGAWVPGSRCPVSDPAPLGLPTMNRCLGHDTAYRITAEDTCLNEFSYDGKYLHLPAKNRVVCGGSLTNGSVAYLSMACSHSVQFAYARKGGSSVCEPSSGLCLVINSATPGTMVTFRDTNPSLLTYIYKGRRYKMSPKGSPISNFWAPFQCPIRPLIVRYRGSLEATRLIV